MESWIKPYVKQYKGRVALTVFFGLLGVASGAMLLFVSGYLISKSALKPENIMIVYIPIVSVRAFSIGQAVFPYLDKLVSHDLVLRILAQLRIRLYKIVEPQALFLQSRYQTGDLLAVLSDDIERLQDFYIRTIFPSILGLVIYAVFAIVLGIFDLIFMVLMLLVLGVIVFLVPLISYYRIRHQHQHKKNKRHTLYRQLTDAIFGQVDWLASGRTKETIDTFMAENDELEKSERHIRKYRHIRDASLRLVAGLAIVAMIIWTDMQAGNGTIAPTIIAAFVLMTFSITDALLPLSEAIESIPDYTDSLERIKKIENSLEKEKHQESINWLKTSEVDINLNDVSYRYPESRKKAIDQLFLSIASGKKIAILGKSGTGKSTLLKLLAGVIEPDQGTVTVNGQQMTSQLLAQAVSVLNQKPHLFDTTIANNIRIGNPTASDEDILKVIKRAQLTSLIEQLPQGIDTPMEEMGSRFSGGERQRIAFARVLLQDTPVILMDEPTIGLDPITERQLLMTMLEAAKDKTVIWVTHHLAGAEAMDEIIFLEDGKINMHGNHQVLYETNARYRTLYEMDEGILSDLK